MNATRKPIRLQAVVGPFNHPEDGRDWHCRCARCGSTLFWEDCESCDGNGVSGHDCGEDCCCCSDPEDNIQCDACGGRGTFPRCMSSHEYCHGHPMPGREAIERNTPEWFTISANNAVSGGGEADVH